MSYNPEPLPFTAATWNVYHGTPGADVARIVRDVTRSHGVTVWLLQEASRDGLKADLLQKLAGRWSWVLGGPQCRILVDLEHWRVVSREVVELSNDVYYTKSGRAVHTKAATAVLCDETGQTLTVMSYHTPPHVQPQHHAPERRLTVLRDAAALWRQVADNSLTTGVLLGGDDNVDERMQRGAWRFMLQRATHLRQLVAPSATLGRRRVDDFRYRGLVPVRQEVVEGAPSDHNIHVADWTWKR